MLILHIVDINYERAINAIFYRTTVSSCPDQ